MENIYSMENTGNNISSINSNINADAPGEDIMPDRLEELLHRFTMATCNIDECYYANGRRLGIKQSELYLMYALAHDETRSQKQIIEEWMIPKTTLNTITKQWEAAGYITLQPIPGKRREMQLCLTPAGREYIDRCLAPVSRAEQAAMQQTLARFPADFIDALEYFNCCLHDAFQGIFDERTSSRNAPAAGDDTAPKGLFIKIICPDAINNEERESEL